MLMAFTYWQLTVQNGWPQWLALVVVLGMIAPLLGALIQRTLMRRLYGASISTTLVITLGLLLSLHRRRHDLVGPGRTALAARVLRRATA